MSGSPASLRVFPVPNNAPNPFLPATPEEVAELGWKQPDVVFVSGDAYVDHP